MPHTGRGICSRPRLGHLLPVVLPVLLFAVITACDSVAGPHAARSPASSDLVALAVKVQDHMEERWPESFGGLWLNEDGDGIVLALSGDREQVASDVVATFPAVRDHLSVVSVRHSLRFLRHRVALMVADRDRIQAGEQGDDIPQPMVATDGKYSVGIDVKRNSNVVFLPERDADVERAFVERYGEPLIFRVGTGQPLDKE